MFFIQYFGLTVMIILGIISGLAVFQSNLQINKSHADIVAKRGGAFDPFSVKLMPSPPKKRELWKNTFDGTKVKIVSVSHQAVGKDSWITVINYVKEGEEQLFSAPEELFMNQYEHIPWNSNPTI